MERPKWKQPTAKPSANAGAVFTLQATVTRQSSFLTAAQPFCRHRYQYQEVGQAGCGL